MSDVSHLIQQIRNIASAYPEGLGTDAQAALNHSANEVELHIAELKVENAALKESGFNQMWMDQLVVNNRLLRELAELEASQAEAYRRCQRLIRESNRREDDVIWIQDALGVHDE